MDAKAITYKSKENTITFETVQRETNANFEKFERKINERPYGQDAYFDGRRHHQERCESHHERKYKGDYYVERRGNRVYDRGPIRPRVDFSKNS